MSTNVEQALWLTVPGARRRVALGWLSWLGLALCGGPLVVATLGPAGAAIALLAVGWLLARSLPAPVECFRHYHLDDSEVTAMGPGAKVRRLAWDRVETVTQRGRTLVLVGDGIRIAVPFRTLAETTLWSAALARVVPELATETWERLEDGEEVRLAPALEPAWGALAWWAWAPAAVAAVVVAGASALAVGAGLALAERAVALRVAHARRVRLDRAGIAVRAGRRGRVIPWSRVEVARVEHGISVTERDGTGTVIRAGLRNFWIALPVIELRATLAPHCPPRVTFRARCANGGLAVVGEVDTVA
ncbi:MAG: hypothetical protein E6J79_04640 [Deltaproteobacteria bacterium]|nr:MAG: hypothetical protein E6J79_04640 [Deltaproteobacteria bacterium]